jgi:hypothetical protein
MIFSAGEIPMRFLVPLSLAFATMFCAGALAQEQQLATEGRGLLPQPATAPAALQGAISHPFEPDPSGGFSRTIFETDEASDFKIIIRDYSFPPDRQTHKITLPSAALFHFLSAPSEISIANQRLSLAPHGRIAVPAGSPIEVVNSEEKHIVIRAFILEAK